MSNEKTMVITEEKVLKGKSGMAVLLLSMLGFLLSAAMLVGSIVFFANEENIGPAVVLMIAGVVLPSFITVVLCGLKILRPNEALVLTLFGKYHGTLKEAGFYWVNPFVSAVNPTIESAPQAYGSTTPEAKTDAATAAVTMAAARLQSRKKVSLKTSTLENKKQKVNDELGNPIEISTIVIWKVVNATKAVLNIDNYMSFISIQCDAVTRNVARCYPYDTNEAGDEWSLRGSSQEIAEVMSKELQEKVADAGIQILEVRITHLAYAPEIASAMLQRQQAAAVIDARQKIVEGAVSMVEMALNKLSANQVVELDEERKAAMVSNLLVVLCGNKDAQPIVNSGSIY